MSLLSEQVKELRNYERIFEGDRIDGNLSSIFRNAADTIEELLAKPTVYDMERSGEYYKAGEILNELEEKSICPYPFNRPFIYTDIAKKIIMDFQGKSQKDL